LLKSTLKNIISFLSQASSFTPILFGNYAWNPVDQETLDHFHIKKAGDWPSVLALLM
jgi:hypothetical protein